MNQDSNPQFTHITVGKTGADDVLPGGEEEVITIGAVEPRSALLQKASPVVRSDAELGDNVSKDQSSGTVRDEGEKEVRSESADDLLGGSMPLAQKLVIAACAVGVIIVIVFLIWYRLR